jgi:DNA-binding LacI/PurR family transcriptional regulator
MSLVSLPTLEPRPGPVAHLTPGAGARTIGVLSFDPTAHGKATVLSGIQHATRELDRCVSMASLTVVDRDKLRAAVERLRRLEVEGVLALAPPRAAIDLLAEVSGELPVVVVGASPQDVLPAVRSDHHGGAAAATRHLLELGHRSVAHIAGPVHESEPGSRLAGWRDTLVAAGAEVPAAATGDGTPESGYALGRRVGARRDVTAIFVGGDQMALGVLRALSEVRRRVPEEVSVVGFGDVPEAEFFNPPLTTVRQDLAQLGRRGVKLLWAEITAGRHERVHETVPAELVLRASTAAAA